MPNNNLKIMRLSSVNRWYETIHSRTYVATSTDMIGHRHGLRLQPHLLARTGVGIPAENSAMVSRVIKESMTEGLIKPFEEEQSRRHAKYLPFWA